MNKIVTTFSILFFAIVNFTWAQQYRPLPSQKIYQKLKQLNTLGTVMYIAAHPDDENTRLISFLVHNDNVKTVYLSLTRGDGGQNILGNEQGAALGLIRTLEMQEARKIDGAEQIYTSVIDFGFTKTPNETFTFWNKNKVVDEIIDAIQLYKPDVVITRFPTTGEGGHGQHTASAIAAQEAFRTIAQRNTQKGNPQLWLPKRLLFNAFRFGNRNTTNENQFKLPINQYDPILGESYSENAGRSRSMHKSQGAGTPQTMGVYNEYFQLLEGEDMQSSLYDNIDTSWSRIGREDIKKEMQNIIATFDFAHPEKSIAALINIRKKINEKVKDTFWQKRKLEEIDQIILSCAGVTIEALTEKQEAFRNETLQINLQIISRYPNQVSIRQIDYNAAVNSTELSQPVLMQSDSVYRFSQRVKIAKNEPYSQPYWLSKTPKNNRFRYTQKYGYPLNEPALNASVTLNIQGAIITVKAPYTYKRLDPIRGDVWETLRIIPDVSLIPVNKLLVYEENKTQNIPIRLQVAHTLQNSRLMASVENKILSEVKIKNLLAGQDTIIHITIEGKKLNQNINDKDVTFLLITDNDTFSHSKNLIAYHHIPEVNYYTAATAKAIMKTWQCTARKIGYVEGAGDYVASVLQMCGLEVNFLTSKNFTNLASLMQYDAIVIGVRTYNTNNHIASWQSLLHQYVQNGGKLIVQYNTNQNLKVKEIGVYPFKLSRNRVTEEDAKVTFLNPDNVLLNRPNTITEKDFDNWVQERGVYFPSEWDNKYQTVLSMHDKNEAKLESAILYTPYGKGHFIYTSLVFFRQLPAGNAGAIKLMMNMLSVE